MTGGAARTRRLGEGPLAEFKKKRKKGERAGFGAERVAGLGLRTFPQPAERPPPHRWDARALLPGALPARERVGSWGAGGGGLEAAAAAGGGAGAAAAAFALVR